MKEALRKKIQEKKYPLATLMLASPYETRADRNLDNLLEESVFNHELYVEPSGKDIEDFETDILNGRFDDTPYYIRASSGSGKTTYLRHFLYVNSEKLKFTLFDFYTATSTLFLLNDGINDKKLNGKIIEFNYQNTKYKFISVLIKQLDFLINKNKYLKKHNLDYNANDAYLSYLSEMGKNFQLRFCDEGECTNQLELAQDLFEIMANIDLDSPDLQKEYLKFKSAFLDSFLETYLALQSDIEKLTLFLLRLIVLLLLCNLNDRLFDERKYCFVFAFDNIEHFIYDDIVFDDDILFIESILDIFLRETETILIGTSSQNTRKNGSVFQGFFRILLSIRDTTNFLKKQIHSADFPISQIVITKWFDISLIHRKKYDFFSFLLSEENKDVYNTMQLVLSDVTKFRNSSGRSIEEMYNHNKRRITSYLGDIFKNKSYRYEYQQMRKVADDISDKLHRNIFKSASRSFINRLMLDNIKKTGYFADIYAIPSKGNGLGKGYARRILNYLNTKKIEGNNGYIGFYDLMREVFKFPYSEDPIPDHIFDNVARIIIKMNDHNMKTTNWCQLVLVKFAKRTIDKDLLQEEIQREYKERSNNENYGIRITEAGLYFLDLLPKFEYYSCRYCNSSLPLFASRNFVDKHGKAIDKYKNIIDTVKDKALSCIEAVYKNDDRFFLSVADVNYSAMYNGDYLYKSTNDINTYGTHHITMIFINHIGYLDNFRGYILLYKSELLQNEAKKEIVKYIISAIEEYIKVFNSYLEKKDKNGIFYIDNYSRNLPRDIQEYVNQISYKLNNESYKISKDDFSYVSIFPENP